MKQRTLVIVLVIAVLIMLVFYLGRGANPAPALGDLPATVGVAVDSGPTRADIGSFEIYDSAKLGRASSGQVVLFFRGGLCVSCRALEQDLRQKFESIPAGVTILDVDYDNAPTLNQKYGVVAAHTLVQVDSSGRQLAKWSGSPTLEALLAELK